MSLLDTFSLIFETDADDAADDVERLSDELDNASDSGDDAARSLNDTSRAANEGSRSFGDLAKSVGGLIAAYVSWQAISSAVLGQALATDAVGKFSETVGISIETIDAWGAAVELSGGSADSFMGSVDSLNEKLGDLALTGGGEAKEVFEKLGISAVDASGKLRTVTDILPELSDAFQTMSEAESLGIGRRLGLDQGTILLLQQGRDVVDQLVEQQRQLGGRTQEGYEASAKFNDEMANTRRIFVGVADSANQRILPVLTKMLDGFQMLVAWVQEHQDFVTGFFIAIAGVITAYYLPAIISAATATFIAISPFLLIAAALAALGVAAGLLYEDIKAYIGGQESFVGSLAAKYEWFGDLLDGVINGVIFLFQEFSDYANEMRDNLNSALDTLMQLFGMVFGAITGDMEGFQDTAQTVTDGVISAFRVMGRIIAEILDFLASPIETTKEAIQGLLDIMPDFGAIRDSISETFDDAIDSTVRFFGGGDEEAEMLQRLEQTAAAGAAISQEANANPILTGGAMANIRSSTINQNNQFNTTVDARGMDRDQAVATYSEQRARELALAKGQFDDGVAY